MSRKCTGKNCYKSSRCCGTENNRKYATQDRQCRPRGRRVAYITARWNRRSYGAKLLVDLAR